MRQHRTLELDPARSVIVHELRVCDLCSLLALLPDDLSRLDPMALIKSRLPDLLTLMQDSLTLPEGETVKGLALGEIEAIGRLWWEMNRDFFQQLLAALGYRLADPSATSSAPASS